MPLPERLPSPDPAPPDLLQRIAAAADLTRRPLRHAVLPQGEPGDGDDLRLWLEVRSAEGERLPDDDLELELYRSAGALHLTLAWRHDDSLPMLWHGGHGVWMDGAGRRCGAPAGGGPLEALARRLRALLEGGAAGDDGAFSG